jgi:hypothetical protein
MNAHRMCNKELTLGCKLAEVFHTQHPKQMAASRRAHDGRRTPANRAKFRELSIGRLIALQVIARERAAHYNNSVLAPRSVSDTRPNIATSTGR